MNSTRNLSIAQRTAVAFCPSTTGTLSMLGSALIVRKVMKREKGTVTTYHRLLFGMSVMDLGFSFWKALGTIPVPVETGAIGARGTAATCTIAGMFTQWGSISPVYMASLSMYFMLKIRYNVKDSEIAKRYEILLHGVPWLICIVTSIIGLALEWFNALSLPELGCWIGGDPLMCPWVEDLECGRGGQAISEHGANLIPWMFSYMWLFASFLVVLVSNVLIYRSIRVQEQKNKSHRDFSLPDPAPAKIFEAGAAKQGQADGGAAVEPSNALGARSTMFQVRQQSLQSVAATKISRSVFYQSLCYVSFAFSTAIWTWLPWLGAKVEVSGDVRLFFALMAAIVFPIQGFFNLLVYVRPRFIRLRKQDGASRARAMWTCFREAP